MGDAHKISIDAAKSWYNSRDYIQAFNTELKKIDRHLYCSFDKDEGYYKVYQQLPIEIWGIGGDWDQEGYEVLKVTLPDSTKPCKPTAHHLRLLKSGVVRQASWNVRNKFSIS